jgi:hypothetical protein
MKLLTAMNRCLQNAGQGSVNDQDSTDPNAAHAKTTIANVMREMEGKSYNFNTNVVTLTVNGDGKVPLSKDYLKVFLRNGLSIRHDDDDQRFVWDISENDYYAEELTDVHVVFFEDEFLNFENDVAQWIAWKAAERYWFEVKQSDPPAYIIRERVNAENDAMNNMTGQSLNRATHFDVLRDQPGEEALVNIDGEWRAV